MKKISILVSALVSGWLVVAQAQVWVDPSTRKDGTYVDGQYRSNPDGNPYNNWAIGDKFGGRDHSTVVVSRESEPYTDKEATVIRIVI